ncbi:hypothetical protein H072_11224 [Dactylellina haptotyla CBS 200.50]|uniref:Uncharacterized protein n=1 Tax=Dactylellina haptotyla (strain CBS 200.50) TaxID=1284197 RepID=S7ZXC5_DACHA|nr:hypothetical protein H072_11224 [Dactylellina haptotyla CBS 200.50]
MEFSDRDTLCPSPQFTIKTQSSTSSFSLHGFKNRLSNIFHSSSAPTSPTEDRKFRMSILSSRTSKTTVNTRRLRKQAVRSKNTISSPRSGKSSTSSLLSKISFRRHNITLKATRMKRFSTFHKKPSTLDFRCAGDDNCSLMILERVNSMGMHRMIFGAVQKRRRVDLTYLLSDCAPTIDWQRPNISGWDFSEIGITIN